MASVMDRQTPERSEHPAQPRTVTPAAAPPGDLPAVLTDRIPGRVAALVALAWVALTPVAYALEPTPADPTVAWYVDALSLAFLWSAGAAIAGLALRRRFGLLASAVAAAVFTVASIACPVSGHHTFGPWWLGQLAISAVLVGLSVVTFRTTRPGAR